MRIHLNFPTALFALAWLAMAGTSALAQAPAKAILGPWDITITTPAGELPSWIDVSDNQGAPKVVFVGVTDHATPLKTFSVKGPEIEFVSPKGESGFSPDKTFKGKLTGHRLAGTVTDPEGTVWHWTGVPAPPLKRATAPKWGKPVSLFNGKDLTGWKPRAAADGGSWKAENGTLVKDGKGSDLLNDKKFEDFKLHIEFNCGQNANSGRLPAGPLRSAGGD